MLCHSCVHPSLLGEECRPDLKKKQKFSLGFALFWIAVIPASFNRWLRCPQKRKKGEKVHVGPLPLFNLCMMTTVCYVCTNSLTLNSQALFEMLLIPWGVCKSTNSNHFFGGNGACMLSGIENQDFRLKLQLNLLDLCPFKSFEI